MMKDELDQEKEFEDQVDVEEQQNLDEFEASLESVEEEQPIENIEELFAQEADSTTDSEEIVVEESTEEAPPEDLGELQAFEAADIEEEEEEEFIPSEQLESVLESLLFVSDRPLSLSAIKQAFKNTSVTTRQIKKALDSLAIEFASAHRGVTLEEVSGGYRLHTKVDNMDFLRKMVKARPFRLSGPAMEVMAIVAYKQPIVKAEIDEIRGVESGHLLRALMDKSLVCFAGKSELPGKPMMYGSTRKFLETFSLKSLKDLPTLSEIDELLPDGIGEEEEKPTLDALTDSLSEDSTSQTYSEGEDELLKITDQLSQIETSSDFFEEEKRRQKEKREAERAQGIIEALDVGEEVPEKDKRWLARYQEQMEERQRQEEQETAPEQSQEAVESSSTEAAEEETVEAESNDSEVEDLELQVNPDDEFAMKAAQEAIEEFEKDELEEVESSMDVGASTVEDEAMIVESEESENSEEKQ